MLIKFEVNMKLSVICILCLLSERPEQVLDAVRGECRLTKNTHDFKDGSANLEVGLDDCNEAVCDDCNVNLYADRILGLSLESFDLEMLLEPFEKLLHLPSIFIVQGDVLRAEKEVVRVVYKTAMQFELLCNASGLGNGHHVESELLKDAMISECIGLRQHLSVDGLVAKSDTFRLPGMGGCYICKLPEASASHKLAEHKNQQMIPVRHGPALGSVVVLGEYTPKLPLGEELCYLCKNEIPNMHICSDLVSDAMVGISKPGQGIRRQKRCA